jgi:hypothetical protein
LHCDVNNTGDCIANLAAQVVCTDDFQCGPSSAGCLNLGTEFQCRNARLTNGTACGDDDACASGRCEFANGASSRTCIAGATAGQDCDELEEDNAAQTCAPGLLCFEGTCTLQAAPGTSCENPDEEADNAMCANGVACDPQWEADLCTDAAVPKTNGGTGLTCDGNN